MPILTFIARVVDGMLLVASMETGGASAASSMASSSSSAASGGGSGGGGGYDASAGGGLAEYKHQAKLLIKKLNSRSPARMSIESGSHTFCYIIEEGVVYLTLTARDYPKRLAFAYLAEIQAAFVDHLNKEAGAGAAADGSGSGGGGGGMGWRHKVETADRPYKFIKFDKVIQVARRSYADPRSRDNVGRLNADLGDISAVMRKSIEEVLNRGEQLEHVSRISSRLVHDSAQFKWGAKKLNTLEWLKRHLPWVAALLVIAFVLYVRFWW